jgi:glycosyltransferase involved in cell wall biosynthesis
MEAISKITSYKSVTNLPNFVKLPPFRPDDSNTGDVFKLLFFSRIEEKKGLDLLIKALAGLDFPYELTIAGDGQKVYIDKLNSLARAHGVYEFIHWAGFQRDNKFKLLAGHNLLILPSHDENFGNVIIESLSQGTAVLVSPQVGLSDYVLANNFGWACALEPAAIARKLNIIYTEPAALKKIRNNAPLKIQVDFDPIRLVKQYCNMYNNIIDG